MSASRKNELLALSIAETAVRADGNLTIPRSFGVYRIVAGAGTSRRYRFGNHPVRRHELDRELGATRLEALFFERRLAEELARLLNAGE